MMMSVSTYSTRLRVETMIPDPYCLALRHRLNNLSILSSSLRIVELTSTKSLFLSINNLLSSKSHLYTRKRIAVLTSLL